MQAIRYPWPSAFTLRATRRTYARHETGSSQGGQFAPREISNDVPQEMREAVEAVKKTAAQRVRAAKLKRQLIDDPDNMDLQLRYSRESEEYLRLKAASDEIKAHALPDSGYVITASGQLKEAKRQTSLFDKSKFDDEGQRTVIEGTEKLREKLDYEQSEERRIIRELTEAGHYYEGMSQDEIDDTYYKLSFGKDSKEKFRRLGMKDFADLDEMELAEASDTFGNIQYEMDSDWESVVLNTFNYHDPESGIQTEFTKLEADEYNSVTVSGVILNKNGNKIGDFDRTINMDGVSHDYFKIDRWDERGSGFGARYYSHLERSYYEAGITGEIKMLANIDVGGYAWARMGYDFQSTSDKNAILDHLSNYYYQTNDEYLEDTGNVPDTAYEVAAFVDPEGRRLGKDVLLGSNWYATKEIDPWSPGWEAGERYYNSKGVETGDYK